MILLARLQWAECVFGQSTAKVYLMNDTEEHPRGEWAQYCPSFDGGEPYSGEFGVEGEKFFKAVQGGDQDGRLRALRGNCKVNQRDRMPDNGVRPAT